MYTDVLVLGAGASVPFGFPTGNALRNAILETFSYDLQNNGVPRPAFIDTLRDPLAFPFEPDDIVKFRDAFWRSQTYSIDAFIERRADEFQEIGKYAIAHCLLRCEEESKIFDTGDWYQAFWNRVLPNGSRDLKNFTVISFNYDRSLQHYLRNAAKFALGKHYQDGAEKSVNIHKLHGGFWNFGDDLPYGGVGEDQTQKFANSIRLPHEFIGKGLRHTPFDDARDSLKDAQRIFILGFGFDETNTERLFDGLDLSHAEIRATGHGLGDGVKKRAIKALGKQNLFYKNGNASMIELISDIL